MSESEKYYSAQQVASMLSCHVDTVKDRLAKGILKGSKPFGKWRISATDLQEYMDKVAADEAKKKNNS